MSKAAFIYPAPKAQTNLQGIRSYAPQLAEMVTKALSGVEPTNFKYFSVHHLAMSVENGGYETINSIYDLRNSTRGEGHMFNLERIQVIAEHAWQYLVGVSELFIDVLVDLDYQPTQSEQYLLLEYGLTNEEREKWVGSDYHTTLKAAYKAEQAAKAEQSAE